MLFKYYILKCPIEVTNSWSASAQYPVMEHRCHQWLEWMVGNEKYCVPFHSFITHTTKLFIYLSPSIMYNNKEFKNLIKFMFTAVFFSYNLVVAIV